MEHNGGIRIVWARKVPCQPTRMSAHAMEYNGGNRRDGTPRVYRPAGVSSWSAEGTVASELGGGPPSKDELGFGPEPQAPRISTQQRE